MHDGPGIRTTVFFKGCPLRCPWCSNPESVITEPEVGVYASSCIGIDKCGRCITACAADGDLAICTDGGRVVRIDRTLCRSCLRCQAACPTDALKLFGRRMRVGELMKTVLADRMCFEQSGGGVTLSGGDPLLQWEFVRDFMAECRRSRVHTCLESELYCKPEVLKAVLPHTSMFLVDIKHMDSEQHKRMVGVPNESILESIRYIVESGVPTVLRTPVVPGFNDTPENIHALCEFVSGTLHNRIRQYQLVPFRYLGEEKYAALSRPYTVKHISSDYTEYEPKLRRLADEMRRYGIPCVAGANVKYDYR